VWTRVAEMKRPPIIIFNYGWCFIIHSVNTSK
jgi:hypothetical protein